MDLTIFLALLFIGIVMTILGVVLIIISLFLSSERTKETRVEYGGVLIIGPLPIVFGSKTKIAVIALILAIVLTLLSIFLFIITNRGLL